MRYTLDETLYIVEEFTTGNTVTISLYKISDDSLVDITSGNCTEMASGSGIFKWDTSELTTQPTIQTEYLWIMDNGSVTKFGQIIMGGYPDDISYTEKWIYIDHEAVVNGNGKSSNPFNNISDAVDFAELMGWKKLIFLSDATLERTLKNFIIEGIGLPTIDLNAQNINESQFSKVKLTGIQVGSITSREVILLPGISDLNGIYKESGVITGGTYTIQEGGSCSIVSSSVLPDGGQAIPPTIDLGSSTTTCMLVLRKFSGSMNIKNVNTSTKLVTTQFGGGRIILDSSCDDGKITIHGLPDSAVTDNSTGSTIITVGNFPSADTIWEHSDAERVLGLLHENIFIDETLFDRDGNLYQAKMRIYSEASSVGTDNDVIGTYQMNAETTGIGKFNHWKQVRI